MKVPQIFDRNMKRLAFLDNAVSVGYSLEINSLWTATFTLPADDDKNAYCQPLNFVEIFDGDERIDLFRIIGEDLERSNGATRFYDCEHVLATLLSDVLFQYHQYGGGGIKTATC
jgi:phage minor structural protein